MLLLEGGPAYQRDEYPDVLLDPERIGGDQEHDWGLRATVGHGGPLGCEIATPRGKVLGGSSAVNATVALRALPGDFSAWAADGLPGWSPQEVLQTYRDLEGADSGDDRFHGRSGPLPIHQRTYSSPLGAGLHRYGQAAGLPLHRRPERGPARRCGRGPAQRPLRRPPEHRLAGSVDAALVRRFHGSVLVVRSADSQDTPALAGQAQPGGQP